MRESDCPIAERLPGLSFGFVITIICFSLYGYDINISVTPSRSGAGEPENKVKKIIEIRKAARPPVLDGELDDECWKDAAVADNFLQLGSDAPAKEQTAARLTYDDDALYLAFVCKESQMSKILAQKTKHDDGVWQDDCVEIFLDTNHDHLSYFQFIVNTLGARQEGRCDGKDRIDMKWDGRWDAKTSTHKDHWVAEVAIPFASLNARPGYWGVNLCREEHASGELSCWAKQWKRFASAPEELALFADAIFEEAPFRISRLLTDNEGSGRNLVTMEIQNRKKENASYEISAAAVAPGGKVGSAAPHPCDLGPGASRSMEFPYEIPRLEPGQWRIDVSVHDRGADRTYAFGSFPFEVKQASPFSITGKVVMGPEYIVPARLRAVIGTLTLRESLCRIRVLDAEGRQEAEKDIPLYPALYPRNEVDVQIDISSLPEGRHVLTGQVVDKFGKPITDKVERAIIKIPGPFEAVDVRGGNLVSNASFEIVNDKGDAAGWAGAWWASRESGLSTVEVKDFLAVDGSAAKDGKRSIRIKSTRGGSAATDEVLTVKTTDRIPIAPGVSYKLTCWWKSDGIVGIGKIWAQTPKRQLVFKGTINGMNPEWIFHETTFMPGEGETWCMLNFSLHGKDGTLWIDAIGFGEEEPSIQKLLPPNRFHPEAVCLLGGNVAGRGLKLVVDVADAGSAQKLGEAATAADGRTVRFGLPGAALDRKCRVTARLVDRHGRSVDSKTATIFGAPLGQ